MYQLILVEKHFQYISGWRIYYQEMHTSAKLSKCTHIRPADDKKVSEYFRRWECWGCSHTYSNMVEGTKPPAAQSISGEECADLVACITWCMHLLEAIGVPAAPLHQVYSTCVYRQEHRALWCIMLFVQSRFWSRTKMCRKRWGIGLWNK